MDRWKKKMIATKRGDFELFIKGEGRPICITHLYSEFNDSGDYFANSFTRDHKVYLVNLKGVGQTDQPDYPHELSMIDAVLDLEAIREALGIGKWTFAGHSTGGMLGCLYGIHFSSSLNRLFIVNAAAREYTSSEKCIYHSQHPQFSRMQQLILELKSPDLNKKERESLTKERTQLSLHKADHYDLYFNQDIHKTISAARLDFFTREQQIFDLTRQLSKIQVETILIGGRHDVQCPIEFSIEMEKYIPDSKLFIFENSNHYPFLEEEEKFRKVIVYQ